LCVQDPQSASSANFTVSFTPSTSSSSLTIGSSGDGMLLWGAMFDYGLNVTNNYHSCFSNYIKTTVSTNSSLADSCVLSSSDSNENNLLAGYPANEFSAYVEFTSTYFFKTTISSTLLAITAGTKYGGGGSSNMRVNYLPASDTGFIQHLYRPVTGGAYDFNIGAPTPLLENNNKIIMTNRQYAPLTSAMNGITGTSATNLVPQRFNALSLGGTMCYKKIFFIPMYLNAAQIIRLTTL
jgi:hypothetical protein